MADLLIARLKDEMKRQGFNYKTLSLAAGLGETSVRDIVSGRARNPRRDTLMKIAQTLGKPVTYFLTEEPVASVPLIGTLGGGAPSRKESQGMREHAPGRLTHDTVPAPPEIDHRDLVAFRIDDKGLLPFLPPGSIVYCREQGDDPAECLDRLCIVHPPNGTAMLRILRRSTFYGLYNLEGFTGKPMENVEIERCARVLFIRQA